MGLNDNEVITSRKKYGSNALTERKKNTFGHLLLESFGDPIIKILLIALAIKIVLLFQSFDWYETLGILIAIFLASFISTISEYGSEQAFNRLQEESSKIKCRVYRNNKLIEVDINDIVMGDLVALSSGDKIPADGLIIDGILSVDESSLNGEAKEQAKEKMHGSLIQEKNKVFRGSVVYSGDAIMKVTIVGDKTIMGKISQELQEKVPDSPLRIKLRGLAKTISKIGYIGALLACASYLFSVFVIDNNFNPTLIKESIINLPFLFNHLIYALTLGVTIIVVAVPEGLPMMITLVLSSNMKKMLKDNVLVRKMVGIETAGSLNLLLTDKTGTLTKGALKVTNFISYSGKKFKNKEDLKIYPNYYPYIYKSFYFNNESKVSGSNIIGGNSTDRALLSFIGTDLTLKDDVISKEPFDSNKKYSYVTLKDGTIFIKGAAEKILTQCDSYLDFDGNIKYLFNRALVKKNISSLTKNASRVIVLAFGHSLEHLTFLGLAEIKDEVRAEAKEALATIKKAGIHTIMITGDAKETAQAIAKEVGLYHGSEHCLESSELNKLSDAEIKKMLYKIVVIARALPQDKSRLVRLGEELNLIVGMTGDGVNDAPALKKANVGFAMGSGTEVAKDASDIVILDNNITSICKAIIYGRTIFKSIRRFIIYQLTVNMCALVLSIIGSFIGVTTPITIVQMLWLNMIMDTFAGLAFSFESPLKEYMDEQPKKKDEPIMNKYMYNQIITIGLYCAILCILFLKLPLFKTLIRTSPNQEYLMTAYFAMFIFLGIFNAFNARTERINIFANLSTNRVFIFIFAFIFAVQTYIIYFGGEIFRTYGLTFKELILVFLLALTVFPLDIIRKIVYKKKNVSIKI